MVTTQLTPPGVNLPPRPAKPSGRKNRGARIALAVFGIGVVAILISQASGQATSQPQQPAQPSTTVAMVTPEGAARAWWPRWRGASGQGIAEGTGYPDTWSDTENVLWKSAVPGRGHSSPIVWQDRIFITTAYPDGRAAVLAYRRSDGRQLWQAYVPDTTPERGHDKNSQASATATTDGKLVYASFGNKGLVAVDFDGKVVWHRSLGVIDAYHGTAGSPLLYDNRLIVFQDHREGAFIAAFDAATGNPLWRKAREHNVGWSTPVAVRAGDRVEIIVSSENRVYAYDPKTGGELWRCGGNTYEVIPTPVVGHGLIFCASGRAGPTLAIRPGGRGDVTSSHVAWKTPRGSPFIPSPLLYGDFLYTLNDMASIATGFRAANGEVMWQGRLGTARREGFSASPVGADGKLFFTNDDGETFVLKAGPKFELLRVNRLNATTLASPALVEGRWYFRTDRQLIAIGKP